MNKLSVVVPVYNEEGSIGEVISGLKQTLDKSGYEYEIIVVDDGSTDNTREISEKAKVKVITYTVNMGYGCAVMTGIKRARYEYVAMIDGDSSYPPEEMTKLLEYIPKFDLVIGARKGKEFWGTFLKYPARLLFLWLAEFTVGAKIPDVNSGLRTLKKSSFEKISLPLLCRGFSFSTTMTLSLLLTGLTVKYVPITYLARKGHSKIRYIRDTLRTLQALTEVIVYYNPLKLIFLLCLLPVLSGLGFVVLYVLQKNPVWLIGVVLLFGFTVIFFILGLILDLLRMNRQ